MEDMFYDGGPDEAIPSDKVLDPECFLEVETLLGRAGALLLLRRLADELREAFGKVGSDTVELARQAHNLTSAAGLIGFSQFSDACRRLETACKTGFIDPFLLGQVLRERERVMTCVDAMLTSRE